MQQLGTYCNDIYMKMLEMYVSTTQ